MIIINIINIMINIQLLVKQYYSLSRYFRLKIDLLMRNFRRLLVMISIFILSIIFMINGYVILSYFLSLLNYYLMIPKLNISNIKFTRRNLTILFISTFINIFLVILIYNLFNFEILLILNYLLNIISLILGYLILLPFEYINNAFYINKARNKIIKNKYLVIGITGSFGKTTMKNMLYSLLKEKYKISSQNHNYNTILGLCKFINNTVKDDDEILIVEIGIDKINSMNKFSKLFSLDYSILTSVGEMHLSTFKNLGNIVKEKLKILNLLNNRGKAYFHESIKEYSSGNNGINYYSSNHLIVKDEFYYEISFENIYIKTPLISKFQVDSLAGAIDIAKDIGLSSHMIKRGVYNLYIPDRRLTTYRRGTNFFIDNSYNGNINSSLESISILNKKKGFNVVVTGGLFEYGNKSKETNLKLFNALDSVDLIIIINNINKDVMDNIQVDKNKIIIFSDYKTALTYIDKNIKYSNVLLLAIGDIYTLK